MYFFNLCLTCILILIFYKYFQDARHQNYLFHGELFIYWRSDFITDILCMYILTHSLLN